MIDIHRAFGGVCVNLSNINNNTHATRTAHHINTTQDKNNNNTSIPTKQQHLRYTPTFRSILKMQNRSEDRGSRWVTALETRYVGQWDKDLKSGCAE